MYPYFQIAEPAEGHPEQSVFTDCLMLFKLAHPETGKRYILAKKFPTLNTCTRASKELAPDAEYIVETFKPRKNSKYSQKRWHHIPGDNGQSRMQESEGR
jgi:hypothetical protein